MPERGWADVAGEAVARGYAQAIFELAERENRTEEFADAFDQIVELLESDDRIRTFIDSPMVEPSERKKVLHTAFEGRVPGLILNFLLVVVDKRRQRYLPAIAREYHVLLDRKLGRVHAEVVLAREPGEELLEEISSELSSRMERTLVPHVRIDPEILGGMIVRYEDRVIDGSLRRRLFMLRRRLLNSNGRMADHGEH